MQKNLHTSVRILSSMRAYGTFALMFLLQIKHKKKSKESTSYRCFLLICNKLENNKKNIAKNQILENNILPHNP